MVNLNIYVEGLSDKDFIQAILESHFPSSKPIIIDLEGNYSRLPQKASRLKEGKLNLIILDSGVNTQELVDEVLKPFSDDEIENGRELLYKCFFIERNLEDLVRKICPAVENALWSCIDQYATCNTALNRSDLRPVDNKAKVYIYANAHMIPNEFKSKTFHNPNLWDLNNEAVNPLVEFLKTHLI